MSVISTFRRRAAVGLCTQCGKARSEGCATRDCPACLQRSRGEGVPSLAEVTAKRDAQLARIVETCRTMTSHEQARELGVTTDRIRYLRHMAREKGYDVPREIGGRKGGAVTTNQESPRWRELEAHKARCKCGLLLPCDACIPSIYEFAEARRGPGRVMPEGGPGGVSVRAKAR